MVQLKYYRSDSYKEHSTSQDAKTEKPLDVEGAKNHVTFATQIDENISQSTVEMTVDPIDNPISHIIFETWIGGLTMASIMIALMSYFVYRISDPNYLNTVVLGRIFHHIKLFPIALVYDLMMHLIVFAAYPLAKATRNKTLYTIFGTMIGVSIFIVGFSDLYFEFLTETGRYIVSVEAIRLQLKVIAFLVEMTDEKTNLEADSFSSLLYYCFVPTLLYAPSYARSHSVRWTRVCFSLVWIFLTVFVVLPAYYEFCIPKLVMDLQHLTWPMVRDSLIANTLLLIFAYMFLVTFFFFEIWCGLWAELLRFADHQFFGPYLKEKNVADVIVDMNYVVSAWLKRYLYIPTIKATKSRLIAFIVTFSLSISYHELVYCFVLKQFILYTHFMGPIAGLFLALKPSILVRIIQVPLFAVGLVIYIFPHVVEYSARMSCDRDIPNDPFVRAVPLFATCLYDVFTNQTLHP